MKAMNTKLPIDRGWAWIILLASFMQMFIIMGQMKCYGIFFVLIQRKFQTPSSITSLVFLVQEFAFSITAFIVMTFGRKLSYRLATLTGALLSTSMYILLGFAETVHLAFLSAVGIGISNGFLYPAAYAMVSTYFDKHRGLANSICNGGLSMGGLVLAPFYTQIMEHYGYTGTYLFVAGVHFNLAITGMLYRPIEFYISSIKSTEQTDELLNQYVDTKEREEAHSDTPMSSRDVELTNMNEVMLDSDTNHKMKKVRNCLSKMINMDTLKDISFIYYLVANIFLCAGNSLVPGYLPPHAFEMGVSADRISWMISGAAIIDLISRPILGYVSDTGWVRRTTMIAVASGILGLTSQFLFVMSTFETILPFALIIGMGQGIYYSLFVVVLLEIIDIKYLKGALGFTCLIQGLSNAVSLLFAGLIRDHTGRYVFTYTFIGSLLLVGSLMIFFLPTVYRRSTKTLKEKEHS